MTVEDRFPVGMRVLAVDDNSTCLRLLEELLVKCQYQVTTTNQAVKALQMLRENRNNFDLVISDVNMPDMDGFKLLELLGLEMDLPVIMLSGYSDKDLVMKGISHGACDYLLKPVRIEELKNIWQHVVRRKKFYPEDQNKSSSQDKGCLEAGEGGHAVSPSGSSDWSGRFNRKRKEQNEDEEEEDEEEEHENEELSYQKKPRVVWSRELHQKFVAAVDQLGYDKAVPKKILDLMNVEGLTRENVASHLQKFRQYLKKLRNPAFGVRDSSYTRMAALDGFGDAQSLVGSQRFSNAGLSPYIPSMMLGRLNSTAGLSIRGTTSGLVQPGHSQNLSNYFNIPTKLQPVLPGNQSPNVYQTIPASLEFKQSQQSKYITHIGESSPSSDSTSYAISSSFPGARVSASSIFSDSNASSNPLILHGTPQQTHGTGVVGDQSSLGVASLNPESFDIGTSSKFLDHNRCSDSWQVAVQLSDFPMNSLPMSEPVHYGQLYANNLGFASSGPQVATVPSDFSSSVLSAPAVELRGSILNQEGLIGDVVPTLTCSPRQMWEEHKHDFNHNFDLSFNADNSMVSANVLLGPVSPSLDQNDAVCSEKMTSSLFDILDGVTSPVMQPSEFQKSATTMNPTEIYSWEQTKSPDDVAQNTYGPWNDVMTAILKRGQNENVLSTDGDFGFDAYSPGSQQFIPL
ncbi:hypothetical protein FF1_017517 [Malus domestica]|nr:two-component response regulator ARR12-like [Malus domestica]